MNTLHHISAAAFAAIFLVAGVGHFTEHAEFVSMLPAWTPWPSGVVWISGVVELAVGFALLAPATRRRAAIAAIVLLVLVFPANLYQWYAGIDAFGLDNHRLRTMRLPMQAILIAWGARVWLSTGTLGGVAQRTEG